MGSDALYADPNLGLRPPLLQPHIAYFGEVRSGAYAIGSRWPGDGSCLERPSIIYQSLDTSVYA